MEGSVITLAQVAKELKTKYVLKEDSNSKMNPYSIKANRHVGFEYLYLSSKLESLSLDDFTAYMRKSLEPTIDKIFAPNQQLIVKKYGLNYINTFQYFDVKKVVNQNVQPFLDLMARLFNDEEERHMVTQYISHLIQQPDIRPSFHILLTSDTGCGKGFLYSEILRPLLANQTMLINTYNRLTSQFSSVLDSNLLLFLDDCKAKSESTMTMIKSLMTESTQCIEEKGYQQKMVNSYTRFILASNSKRPLVIAANERRWYAPKYITHKLNLLETQKFIETVSNWLLLPDSLPAIYNYLAGFDIADFNPKHCKRTDTLLQMIEWSCNPINAVLNDFLENKLYFTFKDVQDHLETSGYKSVKNSVVTDSLRQQDYESKRIKNPNTKKLETYWMKSGCDSACIDFSSSL